MVIKVIGMNNLPKAVMQQLPHLHNCKSNTVCIDVSSCHPFRTMNFI